MRIQNPYSIAFGSAPAAPAQNRGTQIRVKKNQDRVELRFGMALSIEELNNLREAVRQEAKSGADMHFPTASNRLWDVLSQNPKLATDRELDWLSTGSSRDLQRAVEAERVRRQNQK